MSAPDDAAPPDRAARMMISKHLYDTMHAACDLAALAARGLLELSPNSEWQCVLHRAAKQAWTVARDLHSAVVVVEGFDLFNLFPTDGPPGLHAGDPTAVDVVLCAPDFDAFLRVVERVTPAWKRQEYRDAMRPPPESEEADF